VVAQYKLFFLCKMKKVTEKDSRAEFTQIGRKVYKIRKHFNLRLEVKRDVHFAEFQEMRHH
jgi:hypothetical protein